MDDLEVMIRMIDDGKKAALHSENSIHEINQTMNRGVLPSRHDDLYRKEMERWQMAKEKIERVASRAIEILKGGSNEHKGA